MQIDRIDHDDFEWRQCMGEGAELVESGPYGRHRYEYPWDFLRCEGDPTDDRPIGPFLFPIL